ncbi:hypothetical protein Btru_062786 [Bulinus truncatus]|nr:hypothetical protein Btru_062786 [Bulinus truncatus]
MAIKTCSSLVTDSHYISLHYTKHAKCKMPGTEIRDQDVGLHQPKPITNLFHPANRSLTTNTPSMWPYVVCQTNPEALLPGRRPDIRSTPDQKPIDYTTTPSLEKPTQNTSAESTAIERINHRVSTNTPCHSTHSDSTLPSGLPKAIWKPHEDIQKSEVNCRNLEISTEDKVRRQESSNPPVPVYCRAHRVKRRKKSFTISSIMSDSGDEDDSCQDTSSCPQCQALFLSETVRKLHSDSTINGPYCDTSIRYSERQSESDKMACRREEVRKQVLSPFQLSRKDEPKIEGQQCEDVVHFVSQLSGRIIKNDLPTPKPSRDAENSDQWRCRPPNPENLHNVNSIINKEKLRLSEETRLESPSGESNAVLTSHVKHGRPDILRRTDSSPTPPAITSHVKHGRPDILRRTDSPPTPPAITPPVWQTLSNVRHSVHLASNGIFCPAALTIQHPPHLTPQFYTVHASESAVSMAHANEPLLGSPRGGGLGVQSIDSCSPVSGLMMSPSSPVGSHIVHSCSADQQRETLRYSVRCDQEKIYPKLKPVLSQNAAKNKKLTFDGRKNFKAFLETANFKLEFINGGNGIKNPLLSLEFADNKFDLVSSTSLPCPVCSVTFDSAKHLQKHLKAHREIKRFLCTYCGKGFNDAFDLKRHTRTHTGLYRVFHWSVLSPSLVSTQSIFVQYSVHLCSVLSPSLVSTQSIFVQYSVHLWSVLSPSLFSTQSIFVQYSVHLWSVLSPSLFSTQSIFVQYSVHLWSVLSPSLFSTQSIFVQYSVHLCSVLSPSLFSTQSIFVQYSVHLCSVLSPSLFSTQSIFVQYSVHLCSVLSPSLFSTQSIYTVHLCSVLSPSTQFIYTVHLCSVLSPSLQSIFAQYLVHLHSPSLFITQSIYTVHLCSSSQSIFVHYFT